MTRICRTCKETKPIGGFHLHSTYRDGIDARCRECTNKYQREYRKNWGPDGDFKNKKRFLKNKYGLDYEKYLKMVEDQDGLCAICRCPPPFAVDHCHKTGKVRGLLCTTCNLGLGGFKDSFENLAAALRYLEHNQ